MLCQFSFKNFKSYREETIFDLQAEAIHEFEDSLIKQDKCSSLLPVSVIYGPNGGGKTNLIQALSCMISTVVRPIYELKVSKKNIIIQDGCDAEPFLYDSVSKDEPIEFKVIFRKGDYEYRYYIAILNGDIVDEILDRKAITGKKPARIFEREGSDIELGTILKKDNVNTSINNKMPFLSFLAINYNVEVIAQVQDWFESCIVRDYANPISEMNLMVAADDETKNQVIMLLNEMGIDVYDYRIDDKDKQVYIKRKISDIEYELSFEHESDGTKKLITAMPSLLIALKEGRILIINELDAKLHPKLLRYVISMFKNPKVNKYGAQLIFTSHDITTMKNSVFRRDEIYFAALNKEHSSEIYTLYEIRREDNERINSTAAFDKQYMEGRYGADPYLQNMLSGGEWI